MRTSHGLRRVFNQMGTPALIRLRWLLKYESHRVLRGTYTDGRDGCLLWWLDHAIDSRRARRAYFTTPELKMASDMLIAEWDAGMLKAETVITVLSELIAIRQEVNALEAEAIERAEAANKAKPQRAEVEEMAAADAIPF